MAWSTREIAELAGISVRSVRHYHEVGLLPEPERRSNGYKQYGAAHLVRLLRIKRLADLGVGLGAIAEIGNNDERLFDVLRAVDAELEARMGRIREARAEVAQILEKKLATDSPAEFAVVANGSLSESDRRMTSVMGRLLDSDERGAYAELLAADVCVQTGQDFDDLPPDADEAARQDLAARIAAELPALREQHPGVFTLGSTDPRRFSRTVVQVSQEIYNPAQFDVLRRMTALHLELGDHPR
ncbi:MerR family transcriptional regulator [Nocardiopsis mangrovi]|uniref:MerR family transcriptional regulator n=1 Tax=Nocardiopsis mangrovi TaxID=1179818 RepID=A0ABV9DS90_9ACTN